MTNILICTPYRATTHPALVDRWQANAARLMTGHTDRVALMIEDTGEAEPNDGKFSAHARARNRTLESHLARYDYLFWIDADIIGWPDGLIDWALANNPDGVTAPAVVLHRYRDRFYDTWGFIERGQPARLYPPWFDQAGPVIELESVGCCYLIPAQIYRDGARYADTPGATEHLSVMQVARAQGRRVVANLDYRAVHAYLPEYGEALH